MPHSLFTIMASLVMNKHKVLGLIIQGEKNDVLRKQSYGLRNLYVWANAVCLKQSRQPFREIL